MEAGWDCRNIERKGSYISGGPPPKQVVGVFRVTEKTETTVMLVGEKGICKFVDLSPEDADYFPAGSDFIITATQTKK